MVNDIIEEALLRERTHMNTSEDSLCFCEHSLNDLISSTYEGFPHLSSTTLTKLEVYAL